ncbi:SIR2 family protein [Leifsonia sp. SIMBA_070]|uniref:SIR2 family protein n=1 Tax=Leifsonia sp. SIMBA_070 TaxID=3085810 RepID=UPI00397AF8B5
MLAAEKLAEAVHRRQLVVVTGTGVSSALSGSAPTSSWIGLLEHGIHHVKNVDERRAALLSQQLELYHEDGRVEDLLAIASAIRVELKRASVDRYGRWLATTVGELEPTNSDVADALGALAVPLFTTNYDDLLERALNRGSSTWQTPAQMRDIAMGTSNAVGHLHGLWNAPDSVIFDEIDYHRVVSDPAAQALQSSAFAMKNFLFVGFGAGLDDPNFKPMVERFATTNATAAFAHFKLCRADEYRPESELDAIVDVPYGEQHEDLATFLKRLAPETITIGQVDRRLRGQERLLRQVRDNSTLWRENEVLDEKRFEDLIIPPVFLPEPHDQYATNAVVEPESKQLEPLDMKALIASGKVVLVAGVENSGITTALEWLIHEAVEERAGTHGVLIDRPFGSGPSPITKEVLRVYADWGVSKGEEQATLVLGVDNLSYESSARFDKSIADLARNEACLKVVGVPQSDAVEIAKALTENGVNDIEIVYLGRFSDAEAAQIARRVAPGQEQRYVSAVMVIIRDKHLPRTPFTITLLLELLSSGKTLKNQDSEMAVLDEYLNLLLHGEFYRVTVSSGMSLRNKRVVIEHLARKLVEAREDKAPYDEVARWITKLFDDLGWSYAVDVVLDDLKQRRILSTGPGNTIRFQRAIYLELLAGIAAKDDPEFRNLIFASPLELASIVRMYAAMARNDTEVLDIVAKELDRIVVQQPSGSIFASVRRQDAPGTLFRDMLAVEQEDEEPAATDTAVDRDSERTVYYDGSDDSDRPAFLAARLEDLSPARVAMLVVDLASRVLRDSDEIRDQDAKRHYLGRLLQAWVMFLDLWQAELAAEPYLDEVIEKLYDDPDAKPEDLEAFKHSVLRVVPAHVTYSGLSYCLSSPTLDRLLMEFKTDSVELGAWAAMMRTVTLFAGRSTKWIDTLADFDELAVKSWFSASFIATFARYAYIVDDRLQDEQRSKIRAYLREVISARYKFASIDQKNTAMNNFEADLRSARLREERRPTRAIGVLS